jgi:hypothetical protein
MAMPRDVAQHLSYDGGGPTVRGAAALTDDSTTDDDREALPATDGEDEGERDFRNDRWPASLALLACIALSLILPTEVMINPSWVVPLLELLVLVPLMVGRHRHPEEARWIRRLTLVLISLITLSNALSVVLLVHHLLRPGQIPSLGRPLVYSAIVIWFTNVIIFSLWYWEIDRGGPSVRATPSERLPDFLFPQMGLDRKLRATTVEPGWRPRYLDYLYVALTNGAAFSPTDAMPLTRTAKAMMGVQSIISMVTVIVVAARAVNILT